MSNQGKPIVIIGAGGIVEDAHLPAYAEAGFSVAAIADIDITKAQRLAEKFQISGWFGSAEDLVNAYGNSVIYDIAVPGSKLQNIIRLLPDASFALLQKPMGETLQQATAIRSLVEEKKSCAGVNFQLRFAPAVQITQSLIETGALGELVDAEVYVDVFTPWHLWDFLFSSDRMEILYHSIHYIDLFRYLLGEPSGLFASSTADPRYPELSSVRSSILFNYGKYLRATVNTNHTHPSGSPYQTAYVRLEGTKAMVRIQLGVLLDYPTGQPDKIELFSYADAAAGWQDLPVTGNWFPQAFIGSMAEIIKADAQPGYVPVNVVADAWTTMYWVEEAYSSNSKNI